MIFISILLILSAFLAIIQIVIYYNMSQLIYILREIY